MMQLAPLMDSAAVAQLLACSVRTVEDRARTGALPAVKFGEGWMFPSEALLKAINRLAEEDAAQRAHTPAPAAIKHAPVRKGPPNLAVFGG
jgi:excisionase family DNA binding protein